MALNIQVTDSNCIASRSHGKLRKTPHTILKRTAVWHDLLSLVAGIRKPTSRWMEKLALGPKVAGGKKEGGKYGGPVSCMIEPSGLYWV